jgi:hypothetical protein
MNPELDLVDLHLKISPSQMFGLSLGVLSGVRAHEITKLKKILKNHTYSFDPTLSIYKTLILKS